MSTAEETRKATPVGDAQTGFPTTGRVAEVPRQETPSVSPEATRATAKATPKATSKATPDGVPLGRLAVWVIPPVAVAAVVLAWMVSPWLALGVVVVATVGGLVALVAGRRNRARRAATGTASRTHGTTSTRRTAGSRPSLLTGKGRAARREARATGRRAAGGRSSAGKAATSGKRGSVARKAAAARSFLRNPKAHMAAKRAAKRTGTGSAKTSHGSVGASARRRTAGGKRALGRPSALRARAGRKAASHKGESRKGRSGAVSRGVRGRVSRGVSRLADRRNGRTARAVATKRAARTAGKAATVARLGHTAKPRPMGKRARLASHARRGVVSRSWYRTASKVGQAIRKAEPRKYVEALAKPLARPEAPKAAKVAEPEMRRDAQPVTSANAPKTAPRNNGRVTWANRTVKATPPAFTSPARPYAPVPPSSVTGGNRMSAYVHMIDMSTIETRVSTCRDAAEAARRDAGKRAERAEEFRIQAGQLPDEAPEEIRERLTDEARRLEEDAEARYKMAAFYEDKASSYEAERVSS